MPVDPQLAALVARIGAFHITDRAAKRAQTEMESAIAAGNAEDSAVQRYVHTMSRYFEGFSKEARAALRDVDRRLEHVNQVAFNLTAERGVAVKRIEATESVLNDVRALDAREPA
jgi:hypothetical protein